MKIGSLFSGIGGLELGLEWAGLGETIWQVERDSFCVSVLERHWPNAERFSDVCTVGRANLAPVDLICGGFPCQDLSAAGKGKGLAGSRSGLWAEFSRIVAELQPRWVVVENVLGGASRWFDRVCSDLGQLNYEVIPVPLSARDVGAPHYRPRVFLVGYGRAEAPHPNGQRCGTWIGAESAQAQQPQPAGVGRARVTTDANRLRQLQPQGGKRHLRRRPGYRDGWAAEPGICGVAHGVPLRVAKLRALGNAVVPQCAEVVGWVIRELLNQQCEGAA